MILTNPFKHRLPFYRRYNRIPSTFLASMKGIGILTLILIGYAIVGTIDQAYGDNARLTKEKNMADYLNAHQEAVLIHLMNGGKVDTSTNDTLTCRIKDKASMTYDKNGIGH